MAAEYGERWLEPILLAVGAEVDVISDPGHATAGERLARAHDLAVEQGAHAVARSILAASARL